MLPSGCPHRLVTYSVAKDKHNNNMNVAGTPQQKNNGPFGSRPSPAPVVVNSPGNKQGTKPTGNGQSRGCCRGFTYCMNKGSIVSKKQQQQQQYLHQPSTPKLEEQVEELTKEVQRQKEFRIIYRKRMERTQDYLRYCLQVAQDNGLLELMTNNKEDQHQSTLSYNNNSIDSVNTSPLIIQTPLHQHTHQTPLHQIKT